MAFLTGLITVLGALLLVLSYRWLSAPVFAALAVGYSLTGCLLLALQVATWWLERRTRAIKRETARIVLGSHYLN